MGKKDTTEIVKKALQTIPVKNIKDGRNKHGPTIEFECLGMGWEYGYDGSPKGSYDLPKTLKGIMHMMLAKAPQRGLSHQQIYEVFKE